MSSLVMGKAKATRVHNQFEASKEENKIATSPPWRASSSRMIDAERDGILNDKLTFGICMNINKNINKVGSAYDSMRSCMKSSELTRILKSNEACKCKHSMCSYVHQKSGIGHTPATCVPHPQQHPNDNNDVNDNPDVPSQQPSPSTYQFNVVNESGGLDVYDVTSARSQQLAEPASTTTAASDDNESTTKTTTTFPCSASLY